MTTQHLAAVLSRWFHEDVYPFLTRRGFGYRVLDVVLAIANGIVLTASGFVLPMMAVTSRPGQRLARWSWQGRFARPACMIVLTGVTVIEIWGYYAIPVLICMAALLAVFMLIPGNAADGQRGNPGNDGGCREPGRCAFPGLGGAGRWCHAIGVAPAAPGRVAGPDRYARRSRRGGERGGIQPGRAAAGLGGQ